MRVIPVYSGHQQLRALHPHHLSFLRSDLHSRRLLHSLQDAKTDVITEAASFVESCLELCT